MRILHILLLCLMPGYSTAAPAPKFEKQSEPIVCDPGTRKDQWRPTSGQIRSLERAIPAFFMKLKPNTKDSSLPNAANSYSRHYTGIIRDGKMLIYGNYFPASHPWAKKLKKECGQVLDGGNDFWTLVFEPSTGVIFWFRMNGVA